MRQFPHGVNALKHVFLHFVSYFLTVTSTETLLELWIEVEATAYYFLIIIVWAVLFTLPEKNKNSVQNWTRY